MTALWANRVTFELTLIILIPKNCGCLFVPLVGKPFALAVAVNIKKLTEFVGLLLGITLKILLP